MISELKPSLTNRKNKTITKSSRSGSKKNEAKKDLSKTYNEFKQFEGAEYTGMKIGRSHKWFYG